MDRVTVGDLRSEVEHAYAGEGVTTGVTAGLAFRETRGWMRFALTVFDDTDVTIACTFLGNGDVPQVFDLIVENQRVASLTFHSVRAAVVEVRVPLALTKGRTNILVVLRATRGPTPALVEIRTVQDHNE